MNCPTAENVRYDIDFYFDNPDPECDKGVNPIELIRYQSSIPFPLFKKGEKLYTSQSMLHPNAERAIREENRNAEIRFPENMVDDLIEHYHKWETEHHIHYVKIIHVHKSLANEWQPNGKSILVVSNSYKVKECFHWSWSSHYLKRVFTEKGFFFKNLRNIWL